MKIFKIACGFMLLMIASLTVFFAAGYRPPSKFAYQAPLPKDDIPIASPKSEQELRSVLNQTIGEVINFYKMENFPSALSSKDDRRFRIEPDDIYHTPASDYHETLADFDSQGDPPTCSAKILSGSGRIVEFYNYDSAHAYQDSPQIKTKPTAKWTEAHAIEIASKFADIFTKPWGKKYLSKPSTTFSWSGNGVDRKTNELTWEAGEWHVNWYQQTATGIPYGSGGVFVLLSEKYGPEMVSLNFATQLDEEDFTPISKNDALIEARKGFDAMIREGVAYGSFHNPKLDTSEQPPVTLMVLKPNRFLSEPKTMPSSGFLNQSKARLAWQVSFKIYTDSQYTHGYLTVFIDAKDGRLLCCNLTELFWA